MLVTIVEWCESVYNSRHAEHPWYSSWHPPRWATLPRYRATRGSVRRLLTLGQPHRDTAIRAHLQSRRSLALLVALVLCLSAFVLAANEAWAKEQPSRAAQQGTAEGKNTLNGQANGKVAEPVSGTLTPSVTPPVAPPAFQGQPAVTPPVRTPPVEKPPVE